MWGGGERDIHIYIWDGKGEQGRVGVEFLRGMDGWMDGLAIFFSASEMYCLHIIDRTPLSGPRCFFFLFHGLFKAKS